MVAWGKAREAMRISRRKRVLDRGKGRCEGPLAACLVYPGCGEETSVAGAEGAEGRAHEVREVRVGWTVWGFMGLSSVSR